ncbi:MAG: hypothetical protein HYY30_05405 [Chloroflexi bacterium]|nr:hypothetical protein [Chloroflexota bacterium]
MRNWMARASMLIAALSLGLATIVGCTQAVKVGGPEEFYRGKTIHWVVSSTAGSGNDLVTRVVAPYLAKATGATVKVENMGNEEGVNFTYTEGSKEGFTIVSNASGAMVSNDVLKAPGVLYETEKFIFLADLKPSGRVLQVSPKVPYRTLEALRAAKGLKGGGTSAKGSLAIAAAVTMELLGLQGQVITGPSGRKDLTMAVARGEMDLMSVTDDGALKDEADGLVVNVMTIGDKRSTVATELPTMFELGVKVPKELEAPFRFIASGGTAVALPPGVPQDRVDYLRAVFMKLNDDKDLQKDMISTNDRWAPFVAGEELQKEMIVIKSNKELAKQLDAIFDKYKAVR